jgi:hypothetical protein
MNLCLAPSFLAREPAQGCVINLGAVAVAGRAERPGAPMTSRAVPPSQAGEGIGKLAVSAATRLGRFIFLRLRR